MNQKGHKRMFTRSCLKNNTVLVRVVVLLSCLCLGSSQAVGQAPGGIVIKSISTTTPLPLTPIYVSAAGLEASAPVTVQFSNAAGFKTVGKPIRVTTDGMIVIATPLYFNPSTKAIGSGALTLIITQNNRVSAPLALNVQDLPSLSSYGVRLGEISGAVLTFNSLLTARRLNQFQAYQRLLGNAFDSSQAQVQLKKRLSGFLQARKEVVRVANNPNVSIAAGVLAHGTTVHFNANALDMMDRVNAIFLSQTISPFVSAVAANTANPVERSRAASADALHKTLDAIKGVADMVDVLKKMAKGADCAASQDCSLVKNTDNGAAIAGGLAGIMADDKSLWTDEIEGKQFGALGAIVSDAYIIGDSFADVGAFLYAWKTGNQDLMNTVVADVTKNRIRMAEAVVDLAVATPLGKAFEGAQFAVSSLWSLGKLALAEYVDDETGKATPAGMVLLSKITPALDELGLIASKIQWSTSASLDDVQPVGIGVSGNGMELDTVTDVVGNLEIQIPLRVVDVDYARMNLQAVDPTSGLPLGSRTVDISNATVSGVPASIAATTVLYPDRPYNYDPVFCDFIVAEYYESVASEIQTTQESIASLQELITGLDQECPPCVERDIASIALLQQWLAESLADLIVLEREGLSANGCWEQLSAAPTTTASWPPL